MATTKAYPWALLLGGVVLSGCGGRTSDEAFFVMTDDTYDAVDVYIGGAYVDTIQPNDTHSYDLGPGGAVYNVQIYESGDLNYQLNNDDVLFPAGSTSWSVYDNAPIVIVPNNWQPSQASAECVYATVDGTAQSFALTGNRYTPPSDTQICPQETGYFLVDYGSHTVDVVGVTSQSLYYHDQEAYADGTHVTFAVPQ